MLTVILSLLAAAAAPLMIFVISDDWFRRPLRQIAASTPPESDPVKFQYLLLTLLMPVVIIQLLSTEFDFNTVLLAIIVGTGIIWSMDTWLFRRYRAAAATQAGKLPSDIPEPGTVTYARAFFPLAVGILLLRSFLAEPFRMPSYSMTPTIRSGDFILVNKFSYGLRLPVLNHKIASIGEPQRGDVAVFRSPYYPNDMSIKRVIGVPGDRIVVWDDRISVNGKPVKFEVAATRYSQGCEVNFVQATEHLGAHPYSTLTCPVAMQAVKGVESCHKEYALVCPNSEASAADENPFKTSMTVPKGRYFVLGDNRDNSEDSRAWGLLPEDNLVGKATAVWFRWSKPHWESIK